jgi:methionine-rich copper-binding protein CopC
MTDERIIAYLLEELPAEDLQHFEEECFAQEDGLTEVNLVEGDLIEAYLRNELTPERRQRFEQHYLTTVGRQERVTMAAAFLRLVDERNTKVEPAVAVPLTKVSWMTRFGAFWQQQSWALRAAAALVVLTVIIGASWLLFFRPTTPQTFATLTLSISNNNRGDGAQAGKIKLPLDAAALKIFLTLPQASPMSAHYRVELVNADGESKSIAVAGEEAQSVVVVLPAAQLKRGQYALKLYAIESDGTEQRINGSYFFMAE